MLPLYPRLAQSFRLGIRMASTSSLKVYNSLSRSKVPFVPLDPEGKKILWYSCGPTVYDVSHLGHARNYLSNDIIRRILQDYFKYEISFTQNITDVDDKIILKARQQHFFAKYTKEHPAITSEVLTDTLIAYDAYIGQNLSLLVGTSPQDFAQASSTSKEYHAVKNGQSLAGDGSPPGDKEAKIKMHLKTAEIASKALSNPAALSPQAFFAEIEDILQPYLDSLHKESIDQYDHTMFTDLTKRMEQLFFADMDRLNVLEPTKITRVTEYGPQIISFVEKLIAKGFAYATKDGSVYFDIPAFEKAGNSYSHMEPSKRNDSALQAEGEGSLAAIVAEKKSGTDFALWKSSRKGEPAWKSPWGNGRPGWHIECSVMATETLGKQMDVHSGGIDLSFPHHTNELAQSEAYWAGERGCASHNHKWVKYFFHMGHLSIAGAKMSKSLKNFTSIQDALNQNIWSPRGLRLAFLFGSWKDGIELTEETAIHVKSFEDKISNFFIKILNLRRTESAPLDALSEDKLLPAFENTKTVVHEALSDSFDTSTALNAISSLVTDANTAIQEKNFHLSTLTLIAQFVTQIVTIFGLNGKATPDDVEIGWEGVQIPSAAQTFVYPLSELRDQVRVISRSKAYSPSSSPQEIKEIVQKFEVPESDKNAYSEAYSNFRSDVLKAVEAPTVEAKTLLTLCDDLRDTHLWSLDIYLEDGDAPLGALVRPLDSNLKEARTQKEQRDREKSEAKAKREADEAAKQRERDEKARIPPQDLLRTEEYSEWDDQGFPTKDKDGNEVTKSKKKTLTKQYQAQEKLHRSWLDKQK